MKIDKIMRITIAILIFLLAVFFGQIAFAQELPDVNATTQRVFATNADNVYGTLVGILFFAFVASILLIYYIVSKFLPILEKLNSSLQGNTNTIASVTEELKDLQKYIDVKHEMLAVKLESKLDNMSSKIISTIKEKS